MSVAPPKPWERTTNQLKTSPAELMITPSQSPPVPVDALPSQIHAPTFNTEALGDVAQSTENSSLNPSSSVNNLTRPQVGYGSGYGGMGGMGMGGGYGMGGYGMGGMGMGGMYGRGMYGQQQQG